jgi:hypothetical protein
VIFESPDEALSWWAFARHRAESLAAFDPVAMTGRQFSDVCEHCRRRVPVTIGLRPGSGELLGRCRRCGRERAARTVYVLRGQVDSYIPSRDRQLVEIADVDVAISRAREEGPDSITALIWYVLGGLSLRDLLAELRARGVPLTMWGLRRAVREGRAALAVALAARGLLTDAARWTRAPRGGTRAGRGGSDERRPNP